MLELLVAAFDSLVAPVCVVVGARRMIFRNLHVSIWVCSIPVMGWSVYEQSMISDPDRKLLATVAWPIFYYAISYAAANLIDRLEHRSSPPES